MSETQDTPKAGPKTLSPEPATSAPEVLPAWDGTPPTDGVEDDDTEGAPKVAKKAAAKKRK